MRSYTELLTFDTFNERLEYLKLNDYNYNSPRNESQSLFKSKTWQEVRLQIIYRDLGFDLGIFGLYIYDRVIVHHINPITYNDILNNTNNLFDPENLITVSHDTHNRIHYSDNDAVFEERQPGDTILW